jgi:hypothetical protein
MAIEFLRRSLSGFDREAIFFGAFALQKIAK